MGGTSYGVRVLRFPYPTSPVSMDGASLGGADGGVGGPKRRDPINLSFPIRITGASAANTVAKLDTLLVALHVTGARSLRFDGSLSTRFYMAEFIGSSNYEWSGLDSVKLTLNFWVPKPFWKSTTETSQTAEAISASPQAFDVTDGGTVGGNWYAYPIWIIKQTDTTTITSVTLANATTTETIVWTGSLAEDDWLRLDSNPMNFRIEKSTDDGTSWTDAIGGADGGIVPSLNGGVSNSLSVTGVTAGAVDIYYRAEYL